MKLDLVRFWKDESYRESLSAEEKALLAENPAGAIELTDAELGVVEGAATPITTIGFTIGVTLSLAYCSQASACCPPPPSPTTAV